MMGGFVNISGIRIPITADDQTSDAVMRLKQRLDEVDRGGRGAFTGMADGSGKARASAMLLERTLGIEIPRAFNTIMAKSSILGPLIQAAFPIAVIGAAVPALEQVAGAIAKAATWMGGYTEEVKKAYDAQLALNKLLIEHAEAMKKANREIALIGTSGPERSGRELGFSKEDIAERTALVVHLQKQLSALQKIAQETIATPIGEGITAELPNAAATAASGQLPGLVEKLRKAQMALEDATKASEKFSKQLSVDQADAAKKAGDAAATTLSRQAAALTAYQAALSSLQEKVMGLTGDDLGALNLRWDREAATLAEKSAAIGIPFERTLAYQLIGLGREAELQEALDKEFRQVMGGQKFSFPELIAPAKNLPVLAAPDKRMAELEKAMQRVMLVSDALSRSFDDLFSGLASGTRSAADLFRGFADSIIASLGRIISQMLITSLMAKAIGFFMPSNPLGSAGQGSFTGGGWFMSPTPIGHAGGGAVLPNWPIMVGEKGPEIWMPKSAGAIVPNAAVGNNISVQVVNNGTPKEAQASAHWSEQSKQFVVSVVLDDLKRGGVLRQALAMR